MEKRLNLTEEWDKTFPKSEKVDHAKITFHNRYGITLAADLYVPRDVEGKFPAIAVSGPFGAVKEQASGLYAQTLAAGSWSLPSTPLTPEKAAVNPVTWLHPTSTRKTFAQR